MFINEDGVHHIVPRHHQYRALAERYRFEKNMSYQSVRFFLYWGAGCGLSVGEGRDDFADVGICFGAGLAFAGPAAADDDELE